MSAATGDLHARTHPKALLAIVSSGSFLTALTSSVINVALPDMARDLRVDPAQAAWFVLSFLLAVTILLLAAGRVCDILGHGRMYLAGFVLFGAGAAWCALAPSAASLIAARAMQGTASSLVMASSPALMTLAMPPERRGFALGMMSTATYIGLTVGPAVGGQLVSLFGWRSIFWASLAVSVIVALAATSIGSVRGAAARRGGFDWVGAALTAVGTLSFLLLCTRGPSWGAAHPATIACAALSVGLMPVFIWIESKHSSPILDLRLFRSGVFATATLAAMMNYIAMFIASFLLPFALRDGQRMDVRSVGVIMSSQAAAMALLAWGAGWLSDRIGSRGLAAGGMVTMAVGLGGLALTWPSQGLLIPAAWLFVCGAGTGVFISPNSSAIMGAAPRERQGIAGGVMGLARNLGMSLGMAIGSGLFATVFPPGAHAAWSAKADAVVRIGLSVGAACALLSGIIAYLGRPSGVAR